MAQHLSLYLFAMLISCTRAYSSMHSRRTSSRSLFVTCNPEGAVGAHERKLNLGCKTNQDFLRPRQPLVSDRRAAVEPRKSGWGSDHSHCLAEQGKSAINIHAEPSDDNLVVRSHCHASHGSASSDNIDKVINSGPGVR